jgi:hypothetical protein
MPNPLLRYLLAIFSFAFLVYWLSVAGIVSSNDGSHYALANALAKSGSFEISAYLPFTEGMDYAQMGDQYFSDRPPATGIISAIFIRLGDYLPATTPILVSKHDANNPKLAYALLSSIIIGAILLVCFFDLLVNRYLVDYPFALLATLALGFGSIYWKYSTQLYSHALSGFCIFIPIYLFLRKNRYHPLLNAVCGFILGCGVLAEYTNLLPIALISLLIFWHYYQKRAFSSIFFWCVGLIFPAGFLAFYNYTHFGGIFELSMFHVDVSRWPNSQSIGGFFGTPLYEGLIGMLFWASNGNQGLFLLSPIALLGLWGCIWLWKYSRLEFFLWVGVFALMLGLFSMSSTFNPYTNDGRYLAPFVALWFVAVGIGINYLPRNFWGFGSMFFLLFISVRNQIIHIAFSWSHALDTSLIRPWAISPHNLRVLGSALFTNWQNFGLGVLLLIGCLILFTVIFWKKLPSFGKQQSDLL